MFIITFFLGLPIVFLAPSNYQLVFVTLQNVANSDDCLCTLIKTPLPLSNTILRLSPLSLSSLSHPFPPLRTKPKNTTRKNLRERRKIVSQVPSLSLGNAFSARQMLTKERRLEEQRGKGRGHCMWSMDRLSFCPDPFYCNV